MKKHLLGIVFILTGICLYGEKPLPNESPYSVVYNHLYYLQPESYKPEKSKKSFLEPKKSAATQLKKILDAKGMYIDVNLLPKENNYRDTASNKFIYVLDKNEPRIYLEKTGNKWHYSKTTVEALPVLMKETFPIGTNFVDSLQGPFWEYNILGISVFKWLGVLVLLIACFLLYALINSICHFFLDKFLKHRFKNFDSVKENSSNITRLLGLICAVQLFRIFEPYFGFKASTNHNLLLITTILTSVFVILLLVKVSRLIFTHLASLATKTENTMDDQLIPVAQKIVILVIWTLGLLYILESLDINITALLAGISIGGLAIALAAQDTVKNFFGSIMIFLDKPFQIGDWVNFDEGDGTVEEVGLRSTRIRTFANSVVYIPNGKLADKVINNMGLRKYRRFKTDIGITYDTDPRAIDAFIEGIRAVIMTHPTTRKDYFEVHLNSFGTSSINILLYCFFEAPDWTAELRGRHDIMFGIMILAKDLGVEFAFPTQTVHLESMPAQKTEPKFKPKEHNLNKSMKKINDYFKETESEARKDKFRPLGGE